MDLSVVIPVLDEVEVLPALCARLTPALEALGLSWEVVFVDDGSADGSFVALSGLHAKDPRFGVVALSRNFGQQIALQAGLVRARGRAATVLGFTFSAACFAYAAWAIFVTLAFGRHVPGWASLSVAILLVGGAQLVCLGIIGEDIGRIYDEVRHRPLYLVRAELLGDAPKMRAIGDVS